MLQKFPSHVGKRIQGIRKRMSEISVPKSVKINGTDIFDFDSESSEEINFEEHKSHPNDCGKLVKDGYEKLFFPNLLNMSGRGSPAPDSETMDISTGNDEQPPYRLPPDPPVGSDEFLYLHVETITKITELKAKMIKPVHLRLHEKAAPRPRGGQQTPPTQKGKGKRPLDAEGYQIPPKHLVCKSPKENSTDPTPLPTGNPFALPANATPPSNDPAVSTTEQTRKLRIPPYFVRPTPNWIINIAQPFQSRKIADNVSFADIISNRNKTPNVNNNNPGPPQVNNFNSAPPKGSNFNSAPILSDAALHPFKVLSQFAHDDTLHFPSLLNAIRSALPTLQSTQNDNEKAIIIFEHYHAHYCSSR
ncbi:hypothetical protein CDAR_117771 [Caerostris darwini]|uniref:Uncharacterized protein n=1 Tax=Caerostris darwini TaxID=1538125 RepID=A0AAV4PWY4_9ARAC|nr:hypothetical protein CDAR_117771 [Caerostris darwini]